MTRQRRYRHSKRFDNVKQQFKELPSELRRPAVLRFGARCGGVSDEVIDREIGVAELFHTPKEK